MLTNKTLKVVMGSLTSKPNQLKMAYLKAMY